MSVENELKTVCAILADQGLSFWVDSGTLLGLVRDGKILEGDLDIDLGMWASDEALLKRALPAVQAQGYRVLARSYQGEIYRYLFIPAHGPAQLLVDINLFSRSQDHAWCPLVYPRPNKHKPGNRYYYFHGAIRHTVDYFFERNSKIAVDKWPWTYIAKIYCWWIPAYFFDRLNPFLEGLSSPAFIEDYLQYRYGNWRVPQKTWNFYEQDGGIRRCEPKTLGE